MFENWQPWWDVLVLLAIVGITVTALLALPSPDQDDEGMTE